MAAAVVAVGVDMAALAEAEAAVVVVDTAAAVARATQAVVARAAAPTTDEPDSAFEAAALTRCQSSRSRHRQAHSKAS